MLIITKPVPVQTQESRHNPELESELAESMETIARLRAVLQSILNSNSSRAERPPQAVDTSELEQSIAAASQTLQQLKSDNQGLEVVIDSLKRVQLRVTTNPKQRDLEVGGIPVDSDYVIFIIDTSGSMLEIWHQVIDTMTRVLDIHPKVNGFQVMNDNGNYLFESTRRKWIPDIPSARSNVLTALSQWGEFFKQQSGWKASRWRFAAMQSAKTKSQSTSWGMTSQDPPTML